MAIQRDEPEERIEETPTEARQGVSVGWQMRVFLISTAAAAGGLLYYFLIYARPPV
ncbi:MAG: hypothetical protein AB7M12_03005 [Hyphomonadaceae bacterium]